MKFYIDVKGGLGYNFSALRVFQALIKKGHDIKVISPYWDVFVAGGIPVYKPNEYRDFIFDARAEDGIIIEHRLYDMSDFIYKKLNYKDAWCKLLEVDPITDEEYNHLELNIDCFNLKETIDKVKKEINGSFYLTQFWGGQSPLGKLDKYDYENEPLKRHYPVVLAQKVVDILSKEAKVVNYSLPNEPKLTGVKQFTIPYLAYYFLSKLPECKGAITIDSSLAHIITGNCKVLTIWGHSLPDSFGYSCNKNLLQNCRRDEILYFTALGPSGAKIDYAKPEEVINAFN